MAIIQVVGFSHSNEVYLHFPGNIQEFEVEEHAYLLDHSINGQTFFPAAAHILMAWQTLAKARGGSLEDVPVIIHNFKIHQGFIVPDQGIVVLLLAIPLLLFNWFKHVYWKPDK